MTPRNAFSSTERKFAAEYGLILNKKYFIHEVLYFLITLWYISATHIYVLTYTKSCVVLLSGNHLFLQPSKGNLHFFNHLIARIVAYLLQFF